MNILAVDQQPTKFAGGQERSLFEVLTQLSQKPDTKISLCYQEEGELLESYRDFVVYERRISNRVFSSSKFPGMLLDVLKLYGAHFRRQWNVIYCNQYFDLPIFTLLSRLTGIKLACHLRLMCPHYLSHQYRWGLVSAHVLIANSEAVKQSYIDAGIPEHKFRVVPNRINIKEWKPDGIPPKNPKPIFGYFGRLCKEKGILDLIHAFGKMKVSAELHIYGNVRGAGTEDDFLEQCKLAARESGKQNDIHFFPHTSEVAKAMQTCDVIVLPSWEESFGRILLEAMALEIPVIATNVGGVPEVLGDEFANGLVEVKSAEKLARAMDTFSDWRTKDPSLGMRARKYVIDHFSDYNLGTQIMSALKGEKF